MTTQPNDYPTGGKKAVTNEQIMDKLNTRATNNGTARKATLVEQHFQTLVLFAVMAVMAWFGSKTVGTSDSMIRLEARVEFQMEALKTEIVNLKQQLTRTSTEYYPRQEAFSEQRIVNLKLDSIMLQLENHEDRMQSHENRMVRNENRIGLIEESEAVEHENERYYYQPPIRAPD